MLIANDKIKSNRHSVVDYKNEDTEAERGPLKILRMPFVAVLEALVGFEGASNEKLRIC